MIRMTAFEPTVKRAPFRKGRGLRFSKALLRVITLWSDLSIAQTSVTTERRTRAAKLQSFSTDIVSDFAKSFAGVQDSHERLLSKPETEGGRFRGAACGRHGHQRGPVKGRSKPDVQLK